jgi:hypothetical protein
LVTGLSKVVGLVPEEQRLTLEHWLRKRHHDRLRTQVVQRGQGDHTLTLTLRSFDAHRCIFFHIPKNAGISVAMALFNNGGAPHYDARQFRLIFGADFWRYFKFTFVRNPFTRLVSAYEFLKRGGHPAFPRDAAFNKHVLSGYRDFDDFVLQWLTPGRRWMIPHFRPQVEYLTLNNRVVMDFIGRYENLTTEFAKAAGRLGIDAQLPHLNRTSVEDMSMASHYSNDAVVRRVTDVYRKDFELLVYPLRPPS